MKNKALFILVSFSCLLVIKAKSLLYPNPVKPEHCVFNTVFGEVDLDDNCTYETSAVIQSAIEEGLEWLEKAQHPDGGWGAGFHSNQKEMNPHRVPADPATTAMVAMSLLRSGSTPNAGPYAKQLMQATKFLLNAVEAAEPHQPITKLRGTQIQNKLGQNIDLVLTTQYFTNLLDQLAESDKLYEPVFIAINKSVDMVQMKMDENGKAKGSGWAGVLQSAFATNALESAAAQGAAVDKDVLDRSKDYQTQNYDYNNESVETRDGAGVMLYSVSGSVRANAKDARKAKQLILDANEAGILKEEDINFENLIKTGLSEKDAMKFSTAAQVYDSAKRKAQDKTVMKGFGNNGGEEFMSFLQTGESLIINNDESWSDWYEQVSANLTNIQNNDGSWNGHHCITSPVFCTATCLMILSINNDIETLVARGQ